MDPAFHEARQRFTTPKPRQIEHKPTKWQQHLARNPYAQALARPVRKCPLTGVALPAFFLQRFNLIAHPETNVPWFVPDNLETKVPAAPTVAEPETVGPGSEPATHTTAEPEASETVHPEPEPAEPPSPEAAQDPPESAEAELKADKSAAQTEDADKTGPGAYTLASQRLLQELQRDKSPYFRGQKRLLRMSQYGQSKSGTLLNQANWRSDMDTVLLEIMRRRVVERLCYFSNMVTGSERKYLTKCEPWNNVKDRKHRGCLLYLGPPDGNPSSEPASEYVPPRLSTMDMGPVRFGAKLAVHNLRELLGEKHLSELRQQELLQDGSLYLLGRKATVPLQMLLWKLQGYMAWGEQADTAKADGDSAQ
ncbi:uncharacterized protein B0H64DRAFT_416391 [Chaetomium fimeti]|uniref:Uncharacterized protein n=1 Tax=Chaetomium fimeti TaxID=1854472 RepID=A0AAE0HII7_9PEZI|nr:hypothetical protein B0H64DRAFT_416391 [Chaetomium fimeti]